MHQLMILQGVVGRNVRPRRRSSARCARTVWIVIWTLPSLNVKKSRACLSAMDVQLIHIVGEFDKKVQADTYT